MFASKPLETVTIIIEGFGLLLQFFFFLLRRKDVSRLRFFYLILAFVTFNVCTQVISPETAGIGFGEHVIVLTSGMFVAASYYLYYELTSLSEIRSGSKAAGLLLLTATFVLCSILLNYLFGSLFFMRVASLSALTAVFLYAVVRNVGMLPRAKFSALRTDRKLRLVSATIGISFSTVYPIVAMVIGFRLEVFLFNIVFLVALLGYMAIVTLKSSTEYRILQNSPDFYEGDPLFQSKLSTYGLSSQQLLIAKLILAGFTHMQIADMLNVTISTITSTAHRIYQVLGCSGKDDLKKKFISTAKLLRDSNFYGCLDQ